MGIGQRKPGAKLTAIAVGDMDGLTQRRQRLRKNAQDGGAGLIYWRLMGERSPAEAVDDLVAVGGEFVQD